MPACGAVNAFTCLLEGAATIAAPLAAAGHKNFVMDLRRIAIGNLKGWNGNRAVQAKPADVRESVNAT
jgi:hypothetical protein